jgi:hypothetical protein
VLKGDFNDNLILKPIHGCTRTSVVHGTVLRNEIFVFESADSPLTFSWVPSLQREVVNGRMTNQYMGTYLHILKYLFSTGKPGSYSKRALLMKINYAR